MTRSKHHYWYWDEVPCLSSGGAQSPWTRVRASCLRSTRWNGLARWMLGCFFSKLKSWTFQAVSCRRGGSDLTALRPSLPLRALLHFHQETLLFCFDFFSALIFFITRSNFYGIQVFVYWSINLKLFVVYLYTVWHIWSENYCKMKKNSFFGTPYCRAVVFKCDLSDNWRRGVTNMETETDFASD